MQWSIELDNDSHGVLKITTIANTNLLIDNDIVGTSDNFGVCFLDLPNRGFFEISNGIESITVYMPKGLSRNRRRLTGNIPSITNKVIKSVKSVPYGLDSSVLVIIEREITLNKINGQITKTGDFTANISAGTIEGITFNSTNLTLPPDKVSLIYCNESGTILYSDFTSDIITDHYPLGIVSTTSVSIGNILNFSVKSNYISCIKSNIFEEDIQLGQFEKLLALGSLYNCFTTETHFNILINLDGESINLSYPLNNYGSWELYSKQTIDINQKNTGAIVDGHLAYDIKYLDSKDTNIFDIKQVDAGNYSFYSKTYFNTTWKTSTIFLMPTSFNTVNSNIKFTAQNYIIKNGYNTVETIPYLPGKRTAINNVDLNLGVWFLHQGIISSVETTYNYTADYFTGVKYNPSEIDSNSLQTGETGGLIFVGKDEYNMYVPTQNNTSNDITNLQNVITQFDFYTDNDIPILYQTATNTESNTLINLIDIITQFDFYTDNHSSVLTNTKLAQTSNDLIVN